MTTSTTYTNDDQSERARRILGTDHADAGSPAGDLRRALEMIEFMQRDRLAGPGGARVVGEREVEGLSVLPVLSFGDDR